MSKTVLWGIGALVVIGLSVLVYQFTRPSSQTAGSPNGGTTTLPIGGSLTQFSTITPSVDNSGGVTAKTIIDDPATVEDPINPGYYYLGYYMNQGVPDPTATDNPPYIIEYISATQYFNIALLQEPIGPVREEAQQYLMSHLGVSQGQMCQLDYMVSVPVRVNPQYAGINLGFSFCPGATTLPK